MGVHFILQIVGITEGRVLCRPSVKLSMENISDVLIMKDSTYSLTYTPSYGCTGLANMGCDVYVALCPPENEELELVTENGEHFTHTMFLAKFREAPDNEQIIGINPKIAIELMESVIQKKLITCLPNITQFKRNVPMFLEGKVNSTFDFVGYCENNIPFVIEVANVPFAEYRPEDQAAEKALYEAQKTEREQRKVEREKRKVEREKRKAAAGVDANTLYITSSLYNTTYVDAAADAAEEAKDLAEATTDAEDDIYCPYLKTSYFPEADNKTITPTTIKRINELAMIAKESLVRCILGYVIERTDINKFEISKHHPEYYKAVVNAVNSGVYIMPVVVSWTPEGVSFFVTDQIQVTRPMWKYV